MKNLETIILSENVKVEEGWLNGTFSGCDKIKSVTLPKNARVLDGTFSGCSSLEEVILPEGI